MFDDTNLNGLYGDPTVAHNAMIAALAAKALGEDLQRLGQMLRAGTRDAFCRAQGEPDRATLQDHPQLAPIALDRSPRAPRWRSAFACHCANPPVWPDMV